MGNKLKNMASKVIGEKMKKKEPVGDTDSLEDSLVTALGQMSLEQCSGLTVTQIKKVRTLIDTAIEENKKSLIELEKKRDAVLGEMSNWLHESVLLEQNQTETGIKVPEALKMYMPEKYREEIPFVAAAPIDEAESKKAKKQKEGKKAKENK